MQWMKGITLIELMVVVAVLAILLSIGLPSFYNLIAQERLTKQSNEIVAHLMLSRVEAIKRQRTVFICPELSGRCDSDMASAVHGAHLYTWGAGFVTGARGGGDTALEFDDSQDTVLQYISLPNDVLLVGNRKKFSFDQYGHAVSGSFYLCAEELKGRRIVISALGRVRVEDSAEEVCALFNL